MKNFKGLFTKYDRVFQAALCSLTTKTEVLPNFISTCFIQVKCHGIQKKLNV